MNTDEKEIILKLMNVIELSNHNLIELTKQISDMQKKIDLMVIAQQKKQKKSSSTSTD